MSTKVRKRPWLDWEKDFIYLAYPSFSNQDLVSVLNRTKNAIKTYAINLKIAKLPPANPTDKFGRLTLLKRLPTKERKHKHWQCQCECGKITEHREDSIISGVTTSCGCYRNAHLKTGHGYITGTFFGHIKTIAKKRDIKFDLSIEYISNLWQQQNGKCSLTGLDLIIRQKHSFKRVKDQENPTTASLDRIDSDKGYIEGNVQFVHKIVNIMKLTLSQYEFINWCRLVSVHNQNSNSIEYII